MSKLAVYAKARLFVIVPVCDEVECTPVQRVELIVGRDSVGMLVTAMHDALAACESEAAAWDGDNGTWHKYHLMQAALAWADDGSITATDEDGTQATFDAGQERQLAEWLIKRVGARLN